MPTPCESWPLRLASTRLSATVCASSLLLPAAAIMSATARRSCAACKVLLISSPYVGRFVGWVRAATPALAERREDAGVRCAKPSLHHCPDLPRHEFILAVAVLLALAPFTGRGRQH